MSVVGTGAIRCRHTRGFALVIVLWSTLLLSIIAASFAFSMRSETVLAGNHLGRAQAVALADAGIHRGILAMMDKDEETRWRADGTPYSVAFGDGTVEVSVTSERGKIDLNRAPDQLIKGLLESIGADIDAASVADAILDWRDSDDKTRPNGAEDGQYAAEGLPYGARDAPFLSAQEITLVLGMSQSAYQQLASAITVYSGRPRLDPSTAPRQALLAVPGLDAEVVDEFLLGRAESVENETPIPVHLLSAGSRFLDNVRGGQPNTRGTFTIDARATTSSGISSRRKAVVRLQRSDKRPYLILAWSAGDAEEAGVRADGNGSEEDQHSGDGRYEDMGAAPAGPEET